MDDRDGDEKRKSGRGWTPEEDHLLADELGLGYDLTQIAAELSRSVNAVRLRALRMLPDEHSEVSGNEAMAWLRVNLQKGYDWESVLGSRESARRAGEVWDGEEHAKLIEELRDGLPWEDIARAHGRRVSAVQDRAAQMVGDVSGAGLSKFRRAKLLRELVLNDPNYDWLSPLKRRSPFSWLQSGVVDEVLQDAWSHPESRLPDLASALEVSESYLVRRMTALGLGRNLVEVTDRLGCRPGGVVETRRRLALDPFNVELVVLVGLEGEHLRHVSIHADEDGAAKRRAEVAAADSIAWSTTWKRIDPLD